MVARATAVLASGEELLLADLLVAECVYVLESFYEVPRARVAELMRAAIALPSIRVTHESSLLRALEVYERQRLDFAEAYLVAQAEVTSVGAIASFDRSIDRVASVSRGPLGRAGVPRGPTKKARIRPCRAKKNASLNPRCRRRDSNPRHADYDSAALTD
jgi:predicted nucleic-acid-binding protein